MKCSNCGTDIASVEPAMFSTEFKQRSWMNNNKNQLAPYAVLLCPECAARRRTTQKVFFATVLVAIAIIAVAAFVMR
jgi:ribosomal protein L34E